MANPKGNPQNLTKPGDPKHHELTQEDRKKGAETANENYRIAKLLERFGAMSPDAPDVINRMRKFGITDKTLTNEGAIAVRIILGARAGDAKMIEKYLEATGQKVIRNVNENHNIEYKPLVDLTKRKKNGA